MLRLTLVTGFLGSGKTTLLKRLTERDPAKRYVFVVNDFAKADVDGALMQQTDSPVLSVAGGSIFCICKVTDFIERLNEVWERFGQVDPPIDGVIVEASGMADPRVARKLIRDAELDQRFELQSVIGVVEPTSLMKLLKTLPNIKAQIEAADLILVNKADLHDESAMTAAETELRNINPDARLIRTSHCDVDIEPLDPAGTRQIEGGYADCRDPHYHDVSVTIDKPVDLPQFQAEVAAMGEAIFRIKGSVPTRSGWRFIEYAGGRWHEQPLNQSQSALPHPPPKGGGPDRSPAGQLAIIGHGSAAERIDSLAAMLTASTNRHISDMA
jgi:G3E family GTPase